MIAAGVGASVLPALRAQRDALSAAGVPCTLDPSQARPGGAWLKPLKIAGSTFAGAELRAALYLLAPDHGTEPAVAALGDLLDAVLPHVDVDPAVPVDLAVALVTADNPHGYPAALLTLTLDL